MTQRAVFITGSSSGLGRATAKLFSARGWKVFATMRNPEKEKELADLAGVVLLPLDITQPSQIERAAAAAISGGVDVVFNNAGYGMAGPLEGMTVSPGGMKTDFFTRSFDAGRHPAYDALVERVMSAVRDPQQMETYSTPAQIAEVVYDAATDGKDQLRYVAGADAKATYATRLELGDEAFRKAMRQRFFGAGTQEGR